MTLTFNRFPPRTPVRVVTVKLHGPCLRHRSAALLALVIAVVAAGCTNSNFEPVEVSALRPPSIYRDWWRQVEACAEARASFDRVSWYEARRVVDMDDGTDRVGAWVPPHTIYVRSDRVLSEPAVKHEMVHEILQLRDHRSPLFRACAGM